MQEGQDGSSILRNTMIWPYSKVDLEHTPQTSFLYMLVRGEGAMIAAGRTWRMEMYV